MLRSRLIWAAVLCAASCLFFAANPFQVVANSLPQPIECDCEKVGDYVSPAGVKTLAQPQPDGMSPNGKYRVTASGSVGSVTLSVYRVSDNKMVLSTTTSGTEWGFSPDEDRFLIHGASTIDLYDLDAGTNVRRWGSIPASTSSSRLGFSPHGRYFVYTYLDSTMLNTVQTQIVDVRTGAQQQLSYSYYVGQGGKDYGEVAAGFSPDDDDRTYTYGYVTGQSTAKLVAVNLATGAKIVDQTLNDVSAYWQFSPCGDVIGVVRQTGPNQIDVTLLETANGDSLHQQTYPLGNPLQLQATETNHVLVSGTSSHTLAPNTAAATCNPPVQPESPVLTELKLEPTELLGGETGSGTVTLSANAPASGVEVTLSSNHPAVQVSSVTIPAGKTTASFTITTTDVEEESTVTITATADAVSKTATLKLIPDKPVENIPLASLTLSRTLVSPDTYMEALADTVIEAHVTLAYEAPKQRALVRVSAAEGLWPETAEAIVEAGETEATISIWLPRVEDVNGIAYTVSATSGAETKTAVVRVFPPFRIKSFAFGDSCLNTAKTVTGTIELDRPAIQGGVSLWLEAYPLPSGLPDPFILPDHVVTVPPGAVAGTFLVEAVGVDLAQSVIFIATTEDNSDRARGRITLSPPNPAQQWDGPFRNLGLLCGTDETEAIAINVHGHVLGVGKTWHGADRGFLWRDGVMTELDAPDGYDGVEPWALNDNDEVIGYLWRQIPSEGPCDDGFCEPFYEPVAAFYWHDGVMSVIEEPIAWVDQRHRALNNKGQAPALIWDDDEDSGQAVVWQATGEMLPIESPDWAFILPSEINDAGVVVGEARTETGESRAFRWQNGVMTDLGMLPGDKYSYATHVNEAGLVAGVSVGHNGENDVVAWDGDEIKYHMRLEGIGSVMGLSETGSIVSWQYRDLTTSVVLSVPGYARTLPDMNESSAFFSGNRVIGDYHVPGRNQPVLWENGETTMLQDLVPEGSRLELWLVKAVNSQGQVVMSGMYRFPPWNQTLGAGRSFVYDLGAPLPVDLGVEATVSTDTAAPGEMVTVTLAVTNDGPGTAYGAVLQTAVPDGLEATGAGTDDGACTIAAAVVTCVLGRLHPGTMATVTVTLRVPDNAEAGPRTASAVVTTIARDTKAANNAAAVEFETAEAPPNLDPDPDPDPVKPPSPPRQRDDDAAAPPARCDLATACTVTDTGTETILHGEGLTITVPAGVMRSDGGPIILQARAIPIEDVSAVLADADVAAKVHPLPLAFEFTATLADGTTVRSFDRPVVLAIALTGEPQSEMGSPDSIGLFRLNEDGTMTFVGGKVVDGQLIVELWGFSHYVVAEVQAGFTDLAGHWARPDIELLAAKYVVRGQPDGSFQPSGAVTRAEFAAMLARALRLTAPANPDALAAAFSDVNEHDWFYVDVLAAAHAGLLKGHDDGRFHPHDPITREQLAVALARALQQTGGAAAPTEAAATQLLASYTDSEQVAVWARDGLALALREGLVRGVTEARLSPHTGATRAEAAVMMARHWRRL